MDFFETVIFPKESIMQIMEYSIGLNFLKDMEFFKYHFFEGLKRRNLSKLIELLKSLTLLSSPYHANLLVL